MSIQAPNSKNPQNHQVDDEAVIGDVDAERRQMLVNATTAFGLAGAACVALPFIQSMNPNRAVKALATIDVSLTEIPLGEAKTFLWQGKPVFVWHRNETQISEARKGDATATLHPENDADRVQKAEWLVVMGVCTHLGCVPMRGGEFGGWRCPCHGSQFDDSGRVRQGPAGTNLEVPPYRFLDDNTIRIG
ncbi:MAG: ubiquinol-cytochrome c reductase iron-sulfur subunit [Alphaproteobacteria bacterium]|nr:MAG: ubiquinol-cytochrome c reductase iron-sulfur subunit [Alphaproteobacteria bacterium]